MEDLRDVPDEVKNAIEIVPVSEVTELLTYAGILKKTDREKKDQDIVRV